jgi:uncharacterized protein (DUF983 family)
MEKTCPVCNKPYLFSCRVNFTKDGRECSHDTPTKPPRSADKKVFETMATNLKRAEHTIRAE